jgi:rubrerythrin
MGVIETIRKFHCETCGYITYDERVIVLIEKNKNKCPFCGDWDPSFWKTIAKVIYKS